MLASVVKTIFMKNLAFRWGGKVLLTLLSSSLILFSCKKDDTSVDEYRYRRSVTIRTSTTTVDTALSATTVTSVSSPATSGSSKADAGGDQKITAVIVGNNSYASAIGQLDGSKSVGTTFAWEKISGGDGAIVNPTQKVTRVSLKVGTYVFRIKVDNKITNKVTFVVVQGTSTGGSTGSTTGGTTVVLLEVQLVEQRVVLLGVQLVEPQVVLLEVQQVEQLQVQQQQMQARIKQLQEK